MNFSVIKTVLSEHKGYTEDLLGCEFEYICYTQKDYGFDKYNNYIEIKNTTYIPVGFKNIEAKTLKELKIKMSKV